MGYRLRPGLSFCQIGDDTIFLDLNNDRYFRLASPLIPVFRSLAEGRSNSPHHCHDLAKAGIVQWMDGPSNIEPARLCEPRRKAPAMASGRARAFDVARALTLETSIRRQVRMGQLFAVIDRLLTRKRQISTLCQFGDRRPNQIIRSFEIAKYFRSPANLCLTRSIALVHGLSRQGCRAELVMGVRSAPFSAHSWVQVGDVVCNDSPEEAARFTPIFVA